MTTEQDEYDFRPMYARQIRGWLADLRQMTPGSWGHIQMLCAAWNWATSPSRPHTDREARAMRTLAKYCRRRLDRLPGWRELDSGRLLAK